MLDNLRSFIDVARSGTFSAVANARNVAVSSVARQVDVLHRVPAGVAVQAQLLCRQPAGA